MITYRIMLFLEDGLSHSIREILEQFEAREKPLRNFLKFLGEYGFLEWNGDNVKLTEAYMALAS